MLSLARDFHAARVPLELPATPLDEDARHVFQMDLLTAGPTGERITLWRGDSRNRVDVLDRDSLLGQLVMNVRESRRRFHHAVPKPTDEEQPAALVRLLDSGSRLLKITDDSWMLESWTSGHDRRFLVGYDDDHLFIAHAPWGERIRDVHEALKPPIVRDADLRWPGQVVRQGEWFFIPIRPQERPGLGVAIVHKHLPIAGGRHTAEELTAVGDAGYARGAITHPEHRTVTLPDWRRIIRNAAIEDDPWPGLTWVD